MDRHDCGSRGSRSVQAVKLDAFVSGLRGSTDWRAAQAELSYRLSSRPEAAFVVVAALDEDLADRGYDIAVYSVRRTQP